MDTNFYIDLDKDCIPNEEGLKKLGIETRDPNGNLRPFSEMFIELMEKSNSQ
jgi:hypothetical protein